MIGNIDIVDIRGKLANATASADSMRDQIIKGLSLPVGQKVLPTMLLYDERGLRLYDAITTDAAEYYLFPAEEQILKNNANDIVRNMHAGTGGRIESEVVVELGAG